MERALNQVYAEVLGTLDGLLAVSVWCHSTGRGKVDGDLVDQGMLYDIIQQTCTARLPRPPRQPPLAETGDAVMDAVMWEANGLRIPHSQVERLELRWLHNCGRWHTRWRHALIELGVFMELLCRARRIAVPKVSSPRCGGDAMHPGAGMDVIVSWVTRDNIRCSVNASLKGLRMCTVSALAETPQRPDGPPGGGVRYHQLCAVPTLLPENFLRPMALAVPLAEAFFREQAGAN